MQNIQRVQKNLQKNREIRLINAPAEPAKDKKRGKLMMDTLQMLVTIAVIAFATFATRALPFMFFGSREPPAMLSVIQKNLPPMILLLLVVYCLKDVQWLSAPYGVPELFTICVVAGLHFWKRNAMLSIFTGTALYMVLVQLNVFSFL